MELIRETEISNSSTQQNISKKKIFLNNRIELIKNGKTNI